MLLATWLATTTHSAAAQTAPAFSISSPDFQAGAPLRRAQLSTRCGGQNRSPALTLRNPPAGTTSFAVTLWDLDAPGPGWAYWVATGIPGQTRELPENAAGSGALTALGVLQARNDDGGDGYAGLCRPFGLPAPDTVIHAYSPEPTPLRHRYVLTVYALRHGSQHLATGLPAPFFVHEILNDAIAQASITVTAFPPAPVDAAQ